MAEHEFGGATSFKELERQGWGAKAGNYDALGGQITVGAVGPLLDAAGVRTGMRVLDVAAGPGYVAAGADARGAHAVGIDFAADMVSEARRRYPNIEFHEGDAENLAFDTSSFDAVVCAFGLLHMADPDKAIAEAYRVLRPDGRFAFTVWSGPDRHDFFAIVLKALQEHGNTQVSLPPAPPIFRFSDPAECRNVLTRAGFVDASVIELPLKGRVRSFEAILDCIYKGTVRTAAVLERQTPDAIDRIHRAIREGAERFMRDGTYEMAWPAVLAAARKPLS
jgi:ubiquinone/menaquinone biosynthesis C-methylase UbiE